MSINLGDIFFGLVPQVRDLQRARTVVQRFSEDVQYATASVAGFVGFAVATAAISKLASASIEATKQFQRTTMALDSMNEVAGTTASQMQYLMRVSDRTGTQFATNAQDFARLQAASAGTNLEGTRMKEIFESVIGAGARLSLSNEEVEGTLKAIEQIMSKGTVQAEELRGQLGDRLPGAFNIMARALKVSTAELNTLMKQGRVTSDALLPFAQELVRTYGVDLSKSIDTVVAAEGRLQNAFLRFNRTVDQSLGFSKLWQQTLNGIVSLTDTISDHFTQVVGVIKLVALGFVGLFAPAILAGFASLLVLVGDLTAAMIGLNAAMMVNPVLGILSVVLRLGLAIAAVVVGWNLFKGDIMSTPHSNLDDMRQSIEDTAKALNLAAQASASFRGELATQISIQKEAAIAADQEAIAQLHAAKARLSWMQVQDMMRSPNDILGSIFGKGAMTDQIGAEQQVKALEERTKATAKLAQDMIDQEDKINQIITKAGDNTVKPLDPLGGGGQQTAAQIAAVAKAIRDAQQAISDLDAQYTTLTSNPAQAKLLQMQQEATKQVENYRDRLNDAKVPLSTVNALTLQYATSLAKVQAQQYQLQYMPDLWRSLGDVLANSLDTGMDKFIDAIVAGENAFDSLKDVAKAAAVDILKTFTQLAVLNPIKNALFGGSYANQSPFPTASFGGGGGIGGIFQSLLGGIFGGLKTGSAFTGGWGSGAFKAAGGADFTIPHGGVGKGMDSQLVQFWGAPGEKVSIGKRGQSPGGNEGGTKIYYSQNIYGNGNEEIARISRDSAQSVIGQYDKSTVQRTAIANVKGRYRRMVGAR